MNLKCTIFIWISLQESSNFFSVQYLLKSWITSGFFFYIVSKIQKELEAKTDQILNFFIRYGNRNPHEYI